MNNAPHRLGQGMDTLVGNMAGSAGKRVTLIDIAEAAGVSKSTVSLVLQSSPLVKPSTRERVQQSIAQLGYIYNRGAASLRQSRTNLVGMVINDLINPFFAELAVGIERGLHAAGYIPFMANSAESIERQGEVLRTLPEQRPAGLIVSPARSTPVDAFDGLIAGGVPVVLAMRRLPGARIPTVAPDNRQGARLAVAHLIALGHRRIAFLGGYGEAVATLDRVAGYRGAMAAAGLAVDPELIVAGAPNRKTGLVAVGQALGMADPPTAALCFNDVVALGVLSGLRDHGMTPGRDFAVVGFDDVAEADYASPALTTVAVDALGLGEQAARTLLALIDGQGDVGDHVGDVRLIVRQSCGAHAPPTNERTHR